jgi:putative transposase
VVGWRALRSLPIKSGTLLQTCALMGRDPRVYRYRSTEGDDVALRQRLRSLSCERRRSGYRRLDILLRREGWVHNWMKPCRTHHRERLRALLSQQAGR